MNHPDISVRNFQVSDIDSLTILTNDLGYYTTAAQMKARMETISQLENYWTLVAEVDNKVVAYIGLVKNYFWENDGHFIRIQALVVKDEYRRIGVGKKLIEAAERLAADIQARLLVLNCGNKSERAAAHAFYPSMGFTVVSTGYYKRLD